MKKILFFIATLFFVFAGSVDAADDSSYTVKSFDSTIDIQKDSSITVTETILVDFLVPKHGIYRSIPVVYSARGRTINSKFELISVTNERGVPINHESSKKTQSVVLKIGDAAKTITGETTYVIKYKMRNILQKENNMWELYWNVTGHEWDTVIENSTATINTPYALIEKTTCYQSFPGETGETCDINNSGNKVKFSTTRNVSIGNDFTIVVGLATKNDIIFPGFIERSVTLIIDNIVYLVSIAPLVFMLYIWSKKGRDMRFVSDNVYFTPGNKKTRTVGIFERKFLPTVYSPINNLTPSEIGTIIDEKVDINDIVAEITELARLKIIEIIKLDKKGIFGKKDYAFVDISDAKKLGKLEKHQRLIFDSIFELTNLTDTDDVIKRLGDKYGNSQVVLLSSLSQKFYTSLNKIKKELYERMSEKKYFDGNPEKVKGKYIAIAVLVNTLASIAVFSLGIYTYNFVPVAILVFGFIVSIIIAFAMPRRSAHGYSLKRNTEGLKHYLNVGKWRQEIAEKNLFFAEMLPMAISLGVVNQLAKDMESLKIEPPKYMHGFVVSSFARDFANFSSQTTRNLVSTPPGTNVSGHSSWSGGSGFSGGGGGGFGGGGGGSW